MSKTQETNHCEETSYVSDSLCCSTMTEKVAFNRCFALHDDKIECKRAETTKLRNMLYTSAALVDVNNSLEVSYVYVSIIIEYSKLLVLDRQKRNLARNGT